MKLEEYDREQTYRIYVTDALMGMVSNMARYNGDVKIVKRYAEIVYPQEQDTRTAEEIAADITRRAGLVVNK